MKVERDKISIAALLEILLHETKVAHGGNDASFLAQKVTFRRRDGEPNWDAECGIVGTTWLQAFGIALSKVQKQYDLDEESWRRL